MEIKHRILPNLYQDSVSLMQVSALLREREGIEQASVTMATPSNLGQLSDAGLGERFDAGPNDLLVVVRGEAAACGEALEFAAERLTAKPAISAQGDAWTPPSSSLELGLEQHPQANLAIVSVPGDYAAAEAIKALQLGLHVMLFSDNVSLADEKRIKALAREKNLLVMGPDCGTAIVNGLPLGFANRVTRGAIGVVGASGTGTQEVTCRVDQLGAGISQALGTGGHDLHEEIGGSSMLFGLDALAADADTKVIVLISKPPAASVAERILERARAIPKPVVVNFLGADPKAIARDGVHPASTLADAADQAVALLTSGQGAPVRRLIDAAGRARLDAAAAKLARSRRYVRGVFAGGTFCYESQLLLREQGLAGASNTPVKGNERLADIWHSRGHTIVDLGDDDFTRGRPHPMIDPQLRNERIAQEMRDAETAVVLFDVVLGYGAAADPAAGLVELFHSLARAVDGPLLIAHVCGTATDPQRRDSQIERLQAAGVLIADCNAQAAQWAAYAARARS
jgi:succinyl-CoA synthetase alpha subunit